MPELATKMKIGEVVTISMLNNGMAADIFEEVKKTGTRVVVNDKHEAMGLIVAPLDYVEMAPEFRDDKALQIAIQRMKNFDISKTIPAEEVYKELGITQEELDAMPDVEFDYGDEEKCNVREAVSA
ncbi:MAG: hypothetical protein IJT21_08530 [Synergistaceae bacterium]|nr:hypothetical protein [Synergistaceae bacterium]